MTTRREFLKTGVGGALLLNIAACTSPPAEDRRAVVLAALIPVFLKGALPAGGEARSELITRTIAGVDKAISGLSLATQKEIGELFDLLSFAPTRMIRRRHLVIMAGCLAGSDRQIPRKLAPQPLRPPQIRLCGPARPDLRRLVCAPRYLGGHQTTPARPRWNDARPVP